MLPVGAVYLAVFVVIVVAHLALLTAGPAGTAQR